MPVLSNESQSNESQSNESLQISFTTEVGPSPNTFQLLEGSNELFLKNDHKNIHGRNRIYFYDKTELIDVLYRILEIYDNLVTITVIFDEENVKEEVLEFLRDQNPKKTLRMTIFSRTGEEREIESTSRTSDGEKNCSDGENDNSRVNNRMSDRNDEEFERYLSLLNSLRVCRKTRSLDTV